METVTECRGAPRDLGRAQGAAFQSAVRQALVSEGLSTARSGWPSLRPLASGVVLGQGSGRELIRHYPHQAERLAGIALGAGVSLASLVQKSERSVARDRATGGPRAAVGASGEESWLALGLDAPAAACEGWVLRRSLPEVGFASVELTRPWFVSCFAGVNEQGLAVVLSAFDGDSRADALTSSLLVQDCLQRFDRVGACVDWCGKRPAQEGVCFLVADAHGELAKIYPGRSAMPVERSQEGLVFGGVAREVEATLRKEVGSASAGARKLGPGPVWRCVGKLLAPSNVASPASRVVLSPGRRSLELFGDHVDSPMASLEAARTD